MGFIQRKFWDLKCWTEFELWIYEGREFQVDEPFYRGQTSVKDITNDLLTHTNARMAFTFERFVWLVSEPPTIYVNPYINDFLKYTFS